MRQPVSFYAMNAWRWSAGLPEIDPQPMPPLEQLACSEWSDEFERLMRNRLIMGAFRYGQLNAPGKRQFNRIASMQKRLANYLQTGNAEHLVDVANLCMCEFAEGNHTHFTALDDIEHVKEAL